MIKERQEQYLTSADSSLGKAKAILQEAILKAASNGEKSFTFDLSLVPKGPSTNLEQLSNWMATAGLKVTYQDDQRDGDYLTIVLP